MSETLENEINPQRPLERLERGEEISTPALVLRTQPFRESDIIAHLLSPTLGKISAIARHARGSRKRFPSSLDLFDRGTARLALEKNKKLLAVKEFTPAHSLKHLRDDLDKLTLSSLLCEAFDAILQEDDRDGAAQSFELLDLALNAINEATELRTSLRATCLALSTLAKQAGIIDLSELPAGTRALNATLSALETFSERRLATRSALEPLIRRLGK
jgi:recombinational DNA repair protein (RecF pathway)